MRALRNFFENVGIKTCESTVTAQDGIPGVGFRNFFFFGGYMHEGAFFQLWGFE